MGFYFHRIPALFQSLFPNHIWSIPNKNNCIFLTFDDGPIPEVTPFVLDELGQRNIHATFFCLGKNLKQNPELGKRIIAEGHQLANHGYEHVDGWKVAKQTYEDNIKKGELEIKGIQSEGKPIFRPPYGHFRRVRNEVMWSLMSGDFDPKLTKEDCLNRLKVKTRGGDVILFHDNEKSYPMLRSVLPEYLDFCLDSEFCMEKIKPSHA